MIVGLQQCFELFEMPGLKLQGIVSIQAIDKFALAMDFSEVVEALCFENRHGGVGTGRHLKIGVFDSRAEAVNGGGGEMFAPNTMKLDVVGLFEANDGLKRIAIPLHHQGLIGAN